MRTCMHADRLCRPVDSSPSVTPAGMRAPRRRWRLGIVATVALMLAACLAGGADESPSGLSIVWRAGTPHAEVVLRLPPEREEAPKTVAVPLILTGDSGRRLWAGHVDCEVAPDGTARGSIALNLPAQPDAPYRVAMHIERPELGIDRRERMLFGGPRDPVRQHGLRETGRFPEARVALVLDILAPAEFIEVEVWVRDRENNQVLRQTERYEASREPHHVLLDLTPPARSMGPYRVEYQVINDTGSLHFRNEMRFAFANARVPLTSMQSDRLPDWFESTFNHPRGFQRYSITLNNTDTIGPATFDTGTYRSGGRALRMAYSPGSERHLYSNMELPGYPIRLHVWVKGNGSGDRLVAFFRDRCETTRWAHERYVNRSEAVVCTLDFEGWRQFSVPILGDGLQTDSRHESQQAIATPIYMLAFTVIAAAADEADADAQRVIWIDDLMVDTQAAPGDRMVIEMRTDRPDGRLHADGRIHIAIGNGLEQDIQEGRLSLTARDRHGDTVFEHQSHVDVARHGFAFVSLPMATLAAVGADGPVTLETHVTAPAAGGRARGRLNLKAARHAGLVWDFEDAETYAGFGGGAGAGTVAGGQDDRGRALAIEVPADVSNAVLLHPALPGVPDSIELWVKGGAAPVLLEAKFLDAGRTGVASMHYNRLPAPSRVVDWQGWRRIEFPAPAVPVDYEDLDRHFVFEATYPLNLVLQATAINGEAARILVDRIAVRTHMDDADAVTIRLLAKDDTMIGTPDGPLTVQALNYHPEPRDVKFAIRLTNAQGESVLQETRELALPAGLPLDHVLLDALPEGIYALAIEGEGGGVQPLRQTVIAKDLARYLGPDPVAVLNDLPELERRLGMTRRRIYLNWDNLELVPDLLLFDWFRNDIAKASEEGRYTVVPILGFAADWAGPEKWDAVQQHAYERFIGNHMQVPVRLTDWDRYVREAVREFAGHVAVWEFWENPDHRGSPSYIPPSRYGELLQAVRRWVDIYDPGTPIIAGGFSADYIYPYLSSVPQLDELAFDQLGIQFNIGELSPEAADMEGLFDDLDDLLDLTATGRGIDVPQLDWAVGDHVPPVLHGAYHARASMIMQRRVPTPYRMRLMNEGESLDGFGLFHRRSYGNTINIRGNRPAHIPKPAFFAFSTVRSLLADLHFETALRVPDRDFGTNYAYLYRRDGGGHVLALWCDRESPRAYQLPDGWSAATARDAFGTPRPLTDHVPLGPVPLFIDLPAALSAGDVRHAVRTLRSLDGSDQRWLVLAVAEPDSAARAGYHAVGADATTQRRDRRLVGGEPIGETFRTGLEQETFGFTAVESRPCILTRTWFCPDGQTGSHVFVSLNGGPEREWDLRPSESAKPLSQAGLRESSLYLGDAVEGLNQVTVRHVEAGNSAQWTVSPLPAATVDLAYWEPIAVFQSQGFPLASRAVVGTPLRIGETSYATGIGTLAPAFLEYDLAGAFARLEVTVGIDAGAGGSGSAVFTIYADGRQVASSGTLTGFSPSQQLVVEELGSVKRLVLRVDNVEAAGPDALANWVEAVLHPKPLHPKPLE